jgi:hypothetical protein
MADSQKSPSSATAGVTRTDENGEWPNRSHFRKKYQPYGVRICSDTFDEIAQYEDCVIEWVESGGGICVTIETREGRLKAYDGDWIMEDSEGSHYPIADEEIRQTYEPVDEG